MIGTKTEEMGSRKKLLAPVVVLLLCAVSLTGAAYAYQSSVISSQVSVDSDYFTVDLYESDGTTSATAPVVENDKTVVIFTTAVNFSTEKITVTANADDNKVVGKAWIKVNSDVTDLTQADLTLTPNSPTMSGILSGLTVTASINAVKVGGTPVVASEGKYTVAVNTLVEVDLTVTLGGTTSWEVNIGAGAGEYADGKSAAQAFQTAFNNQAKYSISILAEPHSA